MESKLFLSVRSAEFFTPIVQMPSSFNANNSVSGFHLMFIYTSKVNITLSTVLFF